MLAGAGFLVGAQLAFESGTIVDVAAPLLALVIGAFGAIAWSEFAERRVRHRVSRDNELLEQRVRERTADLADAEREIAHRLGVAVEWRDAETGVHIERMGRLCERLAREVGLSVVEAELLRHASALHDVGKVGIPDEILLKPGKLDPAEWATHEDPHDDRREHPVRLEVGARADGRADRAAATTSAGTAAATRDGLAGEQIPLAARICAVCDVFDALLSPRPYKDAWPLADVIQRARDPARHAPGSRAGRRLPAARGGPPRRVLRRGGGRPRTRPPPLAPRRLVPDPAASFGVPDRLVRDHR